MGMYVCVGPMTTGTFKLLASSGHIWEFGGRENNLGTHYCVVHWVLQYLVDLLSHHLSESSYVCVIHHI